MLTDSHFSQQTFIQSFPEASRIGTSSGENEGEHSRMFGIVPGLSALRVNVIS
jgi:hypothetical protein